MTCFQFLSALVQSCPFTYTTSCLCNCPILWVVQPSHCPRCGRRTLQIKGDLKTASVGDEVAGLVGLVVGRTRSQVSMQVATSLVSQPRCLTLDRVCVQATNRVHCHTNEFKQHCPTQAQSERVASDSYRLPCSAAGLGNKTRFLCRLAASATPLHDRVQKVSALSVAVI